MSDETERVAYEDLCGRTITRVLRSEYMYTHDHDIGILQGAPLVTCNYYVELDGHEVVKLPLFADLVPPLRCNHDVVRQLFEIGPDEIANGPDVLPCVGEKI